LGGNIFNLEEAQVGESCQGRQFWRREVEMEIITIEILEKLIKIQWRCPDCSKNNIEWLSIDNPDGEIRKCYYCKEFFKIRIK